MSELSKIDMEKKMKDEKLAQFRHELHQIPELAFDLYETHAYVKKTLEMMGYVTETVAKTGLIAQKRVYLKTPSRSDPIWMLYLLLK